MLKRKTRKPYPTWEAIFVYAIYLLCVSAIVNICNISWLWSWYLLYYYYMCILSVICIYNSIDREKFRYFLFGLWFMNCLTPLCNALIQSSASEEHGSIVSCLSLTSFYFQSFTDVLSVVSNISQAFANFSDTNTHIYQTMYNDGNWATDTKTYYAHMLKRAHSSC